jgi:hypothetical protein
MTEQTRSDRVRNDASDRDPAEGSRDTAKANEQPSGDAKSGHAQHGAGITNRPLEAEQQEQDSLPPRGRNKDEGQG